MTFAQLRILLAVVDHGGFTTAAGRLGMTQPAVSRAIGKLEAEVGFALLDRGRNGLVLTEAGRSAVDHARAALRHHDLLLAEAAAAAGRLSGLLRLASFPTATARLLPPRIKAFTSRHPGVAVRLFEGTDQEVCDWLRGGAAEIGVVTLPSPGLESIPLAQDEMVAVLPANHDLAAASGGVSLSALSREPFILSTGGCEPIITAAAQRAGTRLNVAFEAREAATILAMVAAALGVSVVPALALPAELGAVVARPLDPPVPRSLGLGVQSFADLSPAALAFLEMAAEGQGTPRNDTA